MRHLLLLLLIIVGLPSMAQHTAADSLLNELDNVTVPDSINKKFEINVNKQVLPDSFSIQFNQKLSVYTFEQNKRVFGWQYISSIIIFFVVISIVIMGLYLSYRQFTTGERMIEAARKANQSAADVSAYMNAKMEMGKDGIKIDTAVIGLVILTLSISFLFLYLKYVYPVSIVPLH